MPAGPLRSLTYVHTALRNELGDFAADARALLDGTGNARTLKERFDWDVYALRQHAAGEDTALFPAIEAVHSGVAASFDDRHRMDGALVEETEALFNNLDADGALSTLVRVTDKLSDRASLHMDKEERVLVPFVEDHFSIEQQGWILGEMMQAFPPEFMLKGVPWIFKHLDASLRISYAHALKRAMPAEPFARHMDNVRQELGESNGRLFQMQLLNADNLSQLQSGHCPAKGRNDLLRNPKTGLL